MIKILEYILNIVYIVYLYTFTIFYKCVKSMNLVKVQRPSINSDAQPLLWKEKDIECGINIGNISKAVKQDNLEIIYNTTYNKNTYTIDTNVINTPSNNNKFSSPK